MRAVIFVPNADVSARAGSPGGLALLERQMRQLATLDIERPLVLVPRGIAVPSDVDVAHVPPDTTDVFSAMTHAAASLPSEFVFTSADRVIDVRVLRTLRDAQGSVVASMNGGPVEPVGRATAADVYRDGAGLAATARRFDITSLDPYVPELRGDVPPFIAPVRTATERGAAWRTLLDAVQKRTLDLPGQYFDTPFENAIIRRIAHTRITPNQITAFTVLVAGLTGVLLLHGWLQVGILLALVVGILDGVDGKLARLKLATSRIGALEHVTDFFYENFWYLGLATHLSAAGGVGLWYAGIVLVTCDLADNLLYLAVRLRTGRMLDEISPFDRRFRAIAGRRNVYVMLFAAGVVTGHAAGALLAATGWAIVTVVVHAVRCITVTTVRPGAERVPSGYRLSEIDSPSGALAHEK